LQAQGNANIVQHQRPLLKKNLKNHQKKQNGERMGKGGEQRLGSEMGA